MKEYCFFLYTKPKGSSSISSYKVTITTNKGKGFARKLAIRSYEGNDIIKIESLDL